MVSRLELRGYAWFGVVFVLGVVCGGAASRAYSEREYAQLLGAERDEARDTRRLEALARQLSLDDEQTRRVREVFERRRPERERRLAQMFETCGAPVLADKDEMEAEIRALLRPEQRANFEEFVARHRRFRPGGPPAKNPPGP